MYCYFLNAICFKSVRLFYCPFSDTVMRKKSNHTTNSQAPGLELTLKSPTLQQELVKISTKVSQIENDMSQMMKNMCKYNCSFVSVFR